MKKTTKKDEFELVNLPKECQDPSISKDDFKLIQVDAKIHDQKFETKPTTFLKDCVKRFRKNKSSVVATFILGFLVLMSIVVPIAFNTSSIHDTSVSHPELYYLEPKLFDAGTGFWDGTKKMENVIVDTTKPRDQWGPDPESFNPNAVSELHIGDWEYTEIPSEYAKGGFLQIGYYSDITSKVDYITYKTNLSVAQMIETEEKVPVPDDPDVREKIKDPATSPSIVEVYHPEELEQYSVVDILDFSCRVEYTDPEAGLVSKLMPVDIVELSTNEVLDEVIGTVHLGGLSKTFTQKVGIKKPKVLEFTHKTEITNFVTYDLAKLKKSEEKTKTFPKGYVEAECALYLTFAQQDLKQHEVELTPYKKAHDIGGSEPAIDIQEKFAEYCTLKGLELKVTDIQIEIRVKNAKNKKNSCVLVKSVGIKSYNTENPNEASKFQSYSFEDGNDICSRKSTSGGLWIIGGTNQAANFTKVTNYLVQAVMCSFVYDTYEAVLGKVTKQLFMSDLKEMKANNQVDYIILPVEEGGKWVVDKDLFFFNVLNEKECPLVRPIKYEDIKMNPENATIEYIECEVYRYKMNPYNLTSMPRFLMGTDKTGRDMFIYVFEGLRTSLLLGIATSAICFLFGLLWGSIAGYFGGNVDLLMERFTDILSGVPWIVVMTLTIIHLGSTFFTFALALCLTGWIGTAAITRTQFYRFRGREYVLASRTLGASHARLIAKHILPNAMGTIITSAVLMVPSIIFSEATISYLGLGFKNLASLGVILSDNQVELTNHPYLLIFPAVIIALLMISFNLFGNGLRDAVNPSLKGEGD